MEYGTLDGNIAQWFVPIDIALMGIELYQEWMETLVRTQAPGDEYDRRSVALCSSYERSITMSIPSNGASN